MLMAPTMGPDFLSSMRSIFWRRPSTDAAINMLQASSAMGEEMDKLSDTLEGIASEAEHREVDPLALLVQAVKNSRYRAREAGR